MQHWPDGARMADTGNRMGMTRSEKQEKETETRRTSDWIHRWTSDPAGGIRQRTHALVDYNPQRECVHDKTRASSKSKVPSLIYTLSGACLVSEPPDLWFWMFTSDDSRSLRSSELHRLVQSHPHRHMAWMDRRVQSNLAGLAAAGHRCSSARSGSAAQAQQVH